MAKPIEVTKENPCAHCGKPDWCYRLEPLSVCNRDVEPASGWYKTSKTDEDGHYYYAPIKEKKSPRPRQKRTWEYPDRNGNPLVRVIRLDDGEGGKPKRWQERWDGTKWIKGLKGVKRENIPIYRYQEVQKALSEAAPSATALGQIIFIVEGEPCADALWKLGIAATTNIGGGKKWRPSDTSDVEGARLVLCPDRDQPGVAHMEAIALDFTDAQWLYAYPNSSFWNNLPSNQGLDVADWISDYQLEAKDIWEAIEPRRQNQPKLSILNSAPINLAPIIEENYTQKCQAELYSNKPWLSLNGKIYFWTGKYYQESPKE